MTTAWQLVITAEAEVIPGPASDDANEQTEVEEGE